MVDSKAWNWDKVKEEIWNEPSEDIYYYLNRWQQIGFKKFLDLGCGKGRHSHLFADSGFEVFSFDLSEKAINLVKNEAERRRQKIHVNIGDIKNLPYKSEIFDCILSYHTIYHTDTKGIDIVLDEIYRILKPGGEIFITLNSKDNPSFNNPDYKKIDNNTIIKTEGPEVDMPHYYAKIEEVKRLLEKFKIIRIRHIEEFFNNRTSWHYHVHAQK